MKKDYDYSQANLDNYANQLNPNNDEYYNCRNNNNDDDDDNYSSNSDYLEDDGSFITDDWD